MKKKPGMRPESLMMSHGYNPQWSEGAVKVPMYLTSTFVFESAEAGKDHFALAYGLREPREGEAPGLIYSRLNNPDLQILEERLCLWDGADDCAVFESGMAAISTTLLEFLEPGDLLLHSSPVYGGTDHFIHHFLKKIGVHTLGFTPEMSMDDIKAKLIDSGHSDRLKMVYMETPANPTNALIDIEGLVSLAKAFSREDHQVVTAVDNTYLGPIWQNPMELGVDLVLYSATKYIGGHSDVIAGAVLGGQEKMQRVKALRTFMGNMASPHTGWLLMRSLETLKIRMERQGQTAREVADYLLTHPVVEHVNYLGHLCPESGRDYAIFQKQCKGAGAMISIKVKGGEAEAFQFMNALRLIKVAVSLGGTESLVEHPDTMTHAGVDPEHKAILGIDSSLVRLSVGVEHPDDLIADLNQALNQVAVKEELV